MISRSEEHSISRSRKTIPLRGSSATGCQGSPSEKPRYTSRRVFDCRRRGIRASYLPRRVLRPGDDSPPSLVRKMIRGTVTVRLWAFLLNAFRSRNQDRQFAQATDTRQGSAFDSHRNTHIWAGPFFLQEKASRKVTRAGMWIGPGMRGYLGLDA